MAKSCETPAFQAEVECHICNEAFYDGHPSGQCPGCRYFKWRNWRKTFIWTLARDQVLRERYNSGIRGRAAEIAKDLGIPAWHVKRRAQLLGLSRPWPKDRKEWTEEEVLFLQAHAGKRRVEWIGQELKRSTSSVILKLKRLSISRLVTEGYTLRRLMDCFGYDHKKIDEWIASGLLKATRVGTARRDDIWHTDDREVLRFMLAHPETFRLDRVDQEWFVRLVFGRVRKLESLLQAYVDRTEQLKEVARTATTRAEQLEKELVKARRRPPQGAVCGVCNCGLDGEEAYPEKRPTGPRGKLEVWWYCVRCRPGKEANAAA